MIKSVYSAPYEWQKLNPEFNNLEMLEKRVPFSKEQVERWSKIHHTPFYVYDEAGIRATVQHLTQSFAWLPGFKEYFAVKATPNPHIKGFKRRRLWSRL